MWLPAGMPALQGVASFGRGKFVGSLRLRGEWLWRGILAVPALLLDWE